MDAAIGSVYLIFGLPCAADKISEQAPLAQLAEQLTLNQRVVGSSPTRCTKESEFKVFPIV